MKVFKRYDSIDELKRKVYLWVLPCILLALIINSFLNNDRLFDTIVNSTLIIWFIFSWIMVYFNRWIRFGEYTTLFLVSMYHITTFLDVLYNDLVGATTGSLGDFIVWMPLIFMFFFLILGKKGGFFFSIGVLMITFGIGMKYADQLSPESIDSIIQFYTANIVYILVLFYSQNMFRAFTEVDVFKKHAYLDALTRISNRHQIDEWLEEKLATAEQENRKFSIIFFDIDHFKRINDRFGHKVGDCVLKEIAAIVSAHHEEGDLFGRWGGEEFILITDSSGEQLLQKAERLRKLVQGHHFKKAGRLTASFGIAGYRAGDTSDTLLNRADKALYDSKHKGRNRVSVS